MAKSLAGRGAQAGSSRAPRHPAGPSPRGAAALASARNALAFLKARREEHQLRYVLEGLGELRRAMKRAAAASSDDETWRKLASPALRHVRAVRKHARALQDLLPPLGLSSKVNIVREDADLGRLEARLELELLSHERASRLGERIRFAKFVMDCERDVGVGTTTVRDVVAWAIVAGPLVERPNPNEARLEAWKKAVQRLRRRGGHLATGPR